MRIYFDENFSPRIAAGMREFQSGRRSEEIEVIWCPDEFGRGATDEDWIPKVASKKGVILTQDLNIHRTKAQWDLCKENKVGVFFFKSPRGGWDYWTIVREIVSRWEQIKEEAASSRRPFGRVVELRRRQMKRL